MQRKRRLPNSVRLSLVVYGHINAILRTVMIVRTLIDCFASIPGSEKIQAEVIQDNIDWAKNEKRIFLKQSLEARLISL